MSALPIDAVKIGPRSRQDHGEIGSLARSIADIGLLHPIVVTPDGSLIVGARRLMAFKTLGRETIPVTVVDLERVVLGEYAENTFRKQFTPSECADIADALEPVERALARERQLVMTIGAQNPCFDPALVALLWEIKGVQNTTKEIKSYSRKLLIFSKESKKCKFLNTRARA